VLDAVQPVARPPAHEAADVDGPRIWAIARALAATLVVVALAAAGVLRLLDHETGRALFATRGTPVQAPASSMQSAPQLDLRALREQKRAMLSEYRWIDPGEGVVRIPIERAMALLVARSGAKPR
jgi:hypothetical protein